MNPITCLQGLQDPLPFILLRLPAVAISDAREQNIYLLPIPCLSLNARQIFS
jgi:hypothetical protein